MQLSHLVVGLAGRPELPPGELKGAAVAALGVAVGPAVGVAVGAVGTGPPAVWVLLGMLLLPAPYNERQHWYR